MQSHHLPAEPSDNSTLSWIPNCDGVSTGSLSEAEEKTIKAVCEQMKSLRDEGETDTTTGIYETVRSEVRRAISDIQNDLETAIRRNTASAVTTVDINDVPSDLGSPGAVELVLDIRREYAKKLEEMLKPSRFHVGETSHPKAEMIYKELDELVYKIKKIGYVPNIDFVLHDVDEEQKEKYLLQHSEKIAVVYVSELLLAMARRSSRLMPGSVLARQPLRSELLLAMSGISSPASQRDTGTR